MRNATRIFVFCLALLFALGSLSAAAEPQTVIKAATPFKPGHILADAGEKFKAIVETESKGRISVQLIVAQASEEDVNVQCSQGVVDIQLNGGRPLEVFSPQYFFFNAPYVIKDYEHFRRVWNGPLGQKAKDQIVKNGNMVSLSTVYRGQRQTTSNQPILGPDDLVGLKLRLPVVPTWIAVWKELGTEPVPVTLPELYNALRDGRAEASEGDLPQIVSFKLQEVQSDLSITNHLVAVGWVLYNKTTFEKLAPADQKLVKAAMDKACEWATANHLAGGPGPVKRAAPRENLPPGRFSFWR